MKKYISLLLVISVIATMFAACSSKDKEASKNSDDKSQSDGFEENKDEYIMDFEDVTDKDGKKVTDKNGKAVTTDVNYKIKEDKKGNKYAVKIGKDGKEVTDKKGHEITSKIATTAKNDKSTTKDEIGTTTSTTAKTTTAKTTTMKDAQATTNKELTTIKPDKDSVPSTSASGTPVTFSANDQQILKQMLEVPYLYKQSYENKDGIPTEMAGHVAIWMADREGFNTNVFASGTIVLDLFKYFGQTVVNFKTKCNDESKNTGITYNEKKDYFIVNDFKSSNHTVSITRIENLGNNNYYKLTGTVSGGGKSKVTAIIQRNKLDNSLGFSIKALKWA